MILASEDATTQEIAEALEYMKISVNSGNSYAQYFLGELYLEGEHMEQNAPEAIELFTASAEQGNSFAQYQLGKLYLEGKYVDQDIPKAIFFFEQAAKEKNSYALYQLGKIFMFGIGVAKNKALGTLYLQQSQSLENPFAEALLKNQHLFATKNMLGSLAGLLHGFAREQQMFNRQQSHQKPVRNILTGQQRRKKWRNFIEY